MVCAYGVNKKKKIQNCSATIKEIFYPRI